MSVENQRQDNQTEKRKPTLWTVRRKAVVAIASLALLAAVVIVGSTAWWTRNSNVTAITMDVADFDFNPNYAYEEFQAVSEGYINVDNGVVAPGSRGVIPLKMQATKSEVDVRYSLSMNFEKVDDRFRDRIRFFYYHKDATDSEPELRVFHPAQSKDEDYALKGIVKYGTTNYEFIFWEWVYDLNSDWFCDNGYWYNRRATNSDGSPWLYQWTDPQGDHYCNPTDAEKAALPGTPFCAQDLFGLLHSEEELASPNNYFDAFDTNLGRGEFDERFEARYTNYDTGIITTETYIFPGASPSVAYAPAMYAKFYLNGLQAQPLKEDQIDPETGKKYNPMAGSAWVNLATRSQAGEW